MMNRIHYGDTKRTTTEAARKIDLKVGTKKRGDVSQV